MDENKIDCANDFAGSAEINHLEAEIIGTEKFLSVLGKSTCILLPILLL